MERELFNQVVMTDYGQFDLTWSGGYGFDGHVEQYFDGQVNGLVGASNTEGMYLLLARRSGGSSVRIVLLDDKPGLPEAAWGDVVEVSTYVPVDAAPRWQTWAGESAGSLDVPPGSYRVRVSARNRDAGREGEFAAQIVDEYLIEFWLAPPTPDAIVRVGSSDARYWHGEWGSHR